ncbi:MAG: hypothetical protein WCF99_00660 [Chloroflexales bacterium]
MNSTPESTWLDGGIRGPELYAPALIAEQLACQEPATLTRYAQGMVWLIRAWRLLAVARRLETVRAEQQFLVQQLTVLEARHPQAVAAALTRVHPMPPAEVGEGAMYEDDQLRACEDELTRPSW